MINAILAVHKDINTSIYEIMGNYFTRESAENDLLKNKIIWDAMGRKKVYEIIELPQSDWLSNKQNSDMKYWDLGNIRRFPNSAKVVKVVA